MKKQETGKEKFIRIYKKITSSPFFAIFVIGLIYIIYVGITTIDSLNNDIDILETNVENLNTNLNEKKATIQEQYGTINNLEDDVEEKESEIGGLNLQVDSLGIKLGQTKEELGETQGELKETTRLLSTAKNYEERVQQGIDISQAYMLLGDYDKTVNIVSTFTSTTTPTNDQELWERGKVIYDWLGLNYQYCSDKGFCIDGNNCGQIQFFSPDELLYYGAQDVLCGDCDDKAQLFAGMLYASGVSHDLVRVECGVVPPGGHCWNGIFINNNWILIDPTCSDPSNLILERFGIEELPLASYPINEMRHVTCFDSYGMTSWYNPDGFYDV